NEDAVLVEMLSNAFSVDYSTSEGWEPAKHAETKISGDNEIEISFRLSHQDKAINIYAFAMPDYHGKNQWPFIRLLLNNDTSHNPFTFLRGLEIDQLTVKITVKGFRDVKLQNNAGALSPTNPFQIFGPQPSIGAYLNIKNANIFNRFTKDFAIRLDWLNLPKEPGGFESYYAGYNTGIKNNSFCVGISALSGGQFIPESEIQQKFKLFNTGITKEGIEQLAESTVFRGIDFKRIEFSNEMSLMQEEKPEVLFKEGTIKITIDSPPEAFGHKLFPQIFPKILLHNSKRFSKELPIPSQPFIPSVKSVSIDYKLEYTEFVKGSPTDDDAISSVRLIHQYPFGFDKIYPADERPIYPFVPKFDYPCNLYIGIKDITPGGELSLLFKLEEKNFHHTVHKSNPIVWSYLYGRNWVTLRMQDIVQDTTNNFINSGIIRLKIPPLITKNNNAILNPDLYWLRASTHQITYIKSRVIAIYTH
ncbi:MAG: hypothetical protein ACRDE2_12980, partial [Chitinophagaceae bacterium]